MPGTLRTQQTVSVSQLLRPYPQYGDLNVYGWPGTSDHYYALQMKAERPMANGMTFLVAYNYNQEFHGNWFNDVDYYNNKITMFDRGIRAAQYPRCRHVGASDRQGAPVPEQHSDARLITSSEGGLPARS